MTLRFDEDADVLYVTFAHPKSGTRYVETEKGDVIRFCEETGHIVGVTILFFAERTANGESIRVPEVEGVALSSLMPALRPEEPVVVAH